MQNVNMSCLTPLLFCFTIILATENIPSLAERIWHNESNCSYEKLAWWNEGEEFVSLGIGHFIWFPNNKNFPFTETFPPLLQYMKSRGVIIPQWLKQAQGCPWPSKEDFEKNKNHPQVAELKDFLYQTRLIQAEFIVKRLQASLPQLLDTTLPEDQPRVKLQFNRLFHEPGGLFALIDYTHFKGEGTSEKERYQGKGWGLLQVLLDMPFPSSTNSPLKDFVLSAKKVLDRRIENAPVERNEKRWKEGWHARVNSYLTGQEF